MSDLAYLGAVVAVMTVATFLTRLIPFVALHRLRDHPLLLYLARFMPPAVMTLLVIYSLKDADFSIPPYGAKELVAVALTAAIHVLWSNALVSILCGTGLYMLASQNGF